MTIIVNPSQCDYCGLLMSRSTIISIYCSYVCCLYNNYSRITRIHVITYTNSFGYGTNEPSQISSWLVCMHQCFPQRGYRGTPPTFLALYPLMWSLECIKFFDVFIFMALSPLPFPVNFGGNTSVCVVWCGCIYGSSPSTPTPFPVSIGGNTSVCMVCIVRMEKAS